MPTMKNESRQKRQLNDFSRDSFLILIPGSFFPFWFPPISILGRLWHESEFFCFILLCKCIVPWFSINVYLRIRSWKERRKKERRSFRIMSCFFFFLNARNETARCTATAGLGQAVTSLFLSARLRSLFPLNEGGSCHAGCEREQHQQQGKANWWASNWCDSSQVNAFDSFSLS